MGFRWPTMPGSGGAQVARQVGAVGAGIGVLGEEINLQQAEVEYQDFKLRQKARIDALGDELEKNTDENTYQAQTDKVIAEMQSDMPKNGLAKEFASGWVKNEIPALNAAANESIKRRIKDKSDVKQGQLIEDAIRTGNVVDLAEHTTARVGFGFMSAAQAQKVLADTRNKAEYEAGLNDATANSHDFLNSISIKDGKKHSSRHPELTTGELMALSNVAEGEIANIQRREEIANAALFEDVNQLGIDGVSPGEVARRIRETIGITEKTKTKLMATYGASHRLWNETSVNPWKTTQNPEAVFNMQVRISAGESISELDILKAQIEGGTVNFSRTDFISLKSQLSDNKHPAMKSGFATEWTDVIRELYSIEEVAKGKFIIPKEKLGEWWKVQQQAEIIIKEDYPNTIKANNELLELTKPLKKAKTQSILGKIWEHLSGQPWAIGAVHDVKVMPIPVDTLEEAAALPKNSKFIYQGTVYERN